MHTITTKLTGLTQKDALVAMAEAQDGTVKVSEAKRIFILARLAHGKPKYIGPHIHAILTTDERFEWIAPGTFKLLSSHERQRELLS